MKFLLPIIMLLIIVFVLYRNMNAKKIATAHIQQGLDFLIKNAQQEGVTTTDSGLQYLVLHKGESIKHPTASSKVKVDYRGTLLNGKEFDSSYKRNEPIEFKLNQVIKGWQEGLQLMVEGDKFRLFIPYSLAYGSQNAGPIPAGSTLIFEVELLEIID